MSGQSMAHKVISTVDTRLKLLQLKKKYLTPKLRCLLCNTLVQPHSDYARSAWHPNLSKKNQKKEFKFHKTDTFASVSS